jgi:threonine/homoserine/homoserine lactone efflux protein
LGAALLLQSPILTSALHLIGAIYFGFFGSRLLLAAYRGRNGAPSKADADVDGFKAFSAGYLTAIANPQAIVFFATIFVTMFPALDIMLICIVLALVTGVTLGWYAFVTTILTAAPARRAYDRVRPVIDLAFGILLWTAAIRLALS